MYGEAFPADVTVYLIEAKTLDFGLELSPEVANASATVVAKIESRFLAAGDSAIPGHAS